MKIGEVNDACCRSSVDGIDGEETEDILQGKAVLLGERDVETVVSGGGLQFKVEAATEALAQGESPGLVDTAAEGCVQDELHAAAFVEEAFGDDAGESWNRAENGAAGNDVRDHLHGAGIAETQQVSISQSMQAETSGLVAVM